MKREMKAHESFSAREQCVKVRPLTTQPSFSGLEAIGRRRGAHAWRAGRLADTTRCLHCPIAAQADKGSRRAGQRQAAANGSSGDSPRNTSLNPNLRCHRKSHDLARRRGVLLPPLSASPKITCFVLTSWSIIATARVCAAPGHHSPLFPTYFPGRVAQTLPDLRHASEKAMNSAKRLPKNTRNSAARRARRRRCPAGKRLIAPRMRPLFGFPQIRRAREHARRLEGGNAQALSSRRPAIALLHAVHRVSPRGARPAGALHARPATFQNPSTRGHCGQLARKGSCDRSRSRPPLTCPPSTYQPCPALAYSALPCPAPC